MTNIGVAFTVAGRPYYLKEALAAWREVRGIKDAFFVFASEPVEGYKENLSLISEFYKDSQATCFLRLNNEIYGAQRNPWEAVNVAFNEGCDHVINVDDDLLPSHDILEYHSWANQFLVNKEAVLACSFNAKKPESDNLVRIVPAFAAVWGWGTSKGWWKDLVSPTWDKNYSTGEGYEKGWDHNLNKRVMAPHGYTSLQPDRSRIQNIGRIGVHTTTDNFVEATDWNAEIAPQTYTLDAE